MYCFHIHNSNSNIEKKQYEFWYKKAHQVIILYHDFLYNSEQEIYCCCTDKVIFIMSFKLFNS